MTIKQPRMSKSAVKVFMVLDVLERNFYHGYTPTELAEATGFALCDINSYVNTLLEAGRAERIQQTGRIRVAVAKGAQRAVQMLHSLNSARNEINELDQRINRT